MYKLYLQITMTRSTPICVCIYSYSLKLRQVSRAQPREGPTLCVGVELTLAMQQQKNRYPTALNPNWFIRDTFFME